MPPRRSAEGGPGGSGFAAKEQFARCQDGISALPRTGSHIGETGSCAQGKLLHPKARFAPQGKLLASQSKLLRPEAGVRPGLRRPAGAEAGALEAHHAWQGWF